MSANCRTCGGLSLDNEEKRQNLGYNAERCICVCPATSLSYQAPFGDWNVNQLALRIRRLEEIVADLQRASVTVSDASKS